jgi:uncharacterized protein YraI
MRENSSRRTLQIEASLFDDCSERKNTMVPQKFTHKSLILLLLTALLLSAFIPMTQASAKESEFAVVTVPALNLRSGPSLDYEILRVLPRGQQLSILDLSKDGLWTRVSLAEGVQGWVYSRFISTIGETDAQVLLDGLNLRTGPGFGYRTIRQLSKGQALTVTGRSLQSDWLSVRLPNGTGGWVFSAYILTNLDVAALPVSEAYGGPDGSSQQQPQPSVLVSIRENQAFVDVRGFPASQEISASLGLPGKSSDLRVANGTTNADGSAQLSFSMPAKWSNGTAVKQDHLILQVSAKDGSISLKVDLVYLRY